MVATWQAPAYVLGMALATAKAAVAPCEKTRLPGTLTAGEPLAASELADQEAGVR